MADEAVEKATGGAKGGKLILIIAIVGGLLVVGLTAVVAILLSRSQPQMVQGEPSAEESAVRTKANNELGPLVDMDSFVVNLSKGDDLLYLKAALTVELVNDSAVALFNKWIMVMRNEMLMHLSSVDIEGSRNVEGKRKIEEELRNAMNRRLKRNIVKNVYFTEFVTQ